MRMYSGHKKKLIKKNQLNKGSAKYTLLLLMRLSATGFERGQADFGRPPGPRRLVSSPPKLAEDRRLVRFLFTIVLSRAVAFKMIETFKIHFTTRGRLRRLTPCWVSKH